MAASLYLAPQTRRVCMSRSNGSSNICDKAIELVTLVSSDLVMQLMQCNHMSLMTIGGMVCRCRCEASSLHLGAGILMSTLLGRTPVLAFFPREYYQGSHVAWFILPKRRPPLFIRLTCSFYLEAIFCPKKNKRRCMVASPARMSPCDTRYQRVLESSTFGANS